MTLENYMLTKDAQNSRSSYLAILLIHIKMLKYLALIILILY